MSQKTGGTMSLAQWGLLVVLSILWGGSFFFTEIALEELPVFTIAFGRVAGAALMLHVLVLLSGRRMVMDLKIWAAFFVMGGLNNLVPFSLIIWGQSHIDSGLASILNATTPFFTVIFAHVFTRDEKMTVGRIVGVCIGVIGVGVMIGPEVLKSLGVNTLSQIAILGASISYALAGIFGRRFGGQSPMVTATGQVTASSIMLFPFVMLVDKPWQIGVPSAQVFAAILGIALLCTVVAYVIYFKLLASAGATNLLLVTFLIPVSAIMLGVFVLGEQLGAGEVFGMALIGLGLAAIDGRLVKAVITNKKARG